jgi:hypothetical protein
MAKFQRREKNKNGEERPMMKITTCLTALAFAASTLPTLIIADQAMAAPKAAKSSSAEAKGGKSTSAKAGKSNKAKVQKAAAKSCGTFMYTDKKSGKCADARNKK